MNRYQCRECEGWFDGGHYCTGRGRTNTRVDTAVSFTRRRLGQLIDERLIPLGFTPAGVRTTENGDHGEVWEFQYMSSLGAGIGCGITEFEVRMASVTLSDIATSMAHKIATRAQREGRHE